MKKLMFVSALFVALSMSIAEADPLRKTPRGESEALATADYGGVDISTSRFSASHATVTLTGRGVVYGAFFSSGAATDFDFVDVYDATATIVSANFHIARFYNVENTTSATTSTALGFSGPPRPIRFNRGLIWKPSVATYNVITLHFYKEQ